MYELVDILALAILQDDSLQLAHLLFLRLFSRDASPRCHGSARCLIGADRLQKDAGIRIGIAAWYELQTKAVLNSP